MWPPSLRRAAARLAAAAALAAALLHSAPLAAHDLWIEPTAWTPRVGQVVGASLRVGQKLQGDALQLAPLQINRFFIDDGAEPRPLVLPRAAGTNGIARIMRNGLQVIGYHSHPVPIELAAEKFNAYLADEGLDAVIAERARRGQTDAPANEQYTRCAKSLVLAGPADAGQGDHALGMPLELVAERSPYGLGPDVELALRLSFEGQALAGALVVALNRDRPESEQRVRSDAHGRVRFHIGAPGVWLIKAVHMVGADPGSGADWSSFWASLTFRLPAAGAPDL